MADKFLSDEDKDLFREHMRGVKPLDKEKTQKLPTAKPIAPPRKKHPIPIVTPSPITIPHLSDFIQETVYSETILSYACPGVSHKRLNELRKGQIPWEARLDLHGMTTEEGRMSLSRFIEMQTQNHKRCLLIIHGKGGYKGAPPVIKNRVNRWLTQFDQVVAFHSAQPKDGGTGAIYVLLKKNPLR